MNIFIDTEDMEERYGEQLYYDFLIEQSIDLQQRIDKAIEYIKNNSCGDLAITFGKDLLEILKGSDKE